MESGFDPFQEKGKSWIETRIVFSCMFRLFLSLPGHIPPAQQASADSLSLMPGFRNNSLQVSVTSEDVWGILD